MYWSLVLGSGGCRACADRTSVFCAASALGRPSFAQGCTLVGSCFCCSSGGVSAFVLSSGISGAGDVCRILGRVPSSGVWAAAFGRAPGFGGARSAGVVVAGLVFTGLA